MRAGIGRRGRAVSIRIVKYALVSGAILLTVGASGCATDAVAPAGSVSTVIRPMDEAAVAAVKRMAGIIRIRSANGEIEMTPQYNAILRLDSIGATQGAPAFSTVSSYSAETGEVYDPDDTRLAFGAGTATKLELGADKSEAILTSDFLTLAQLTVAGAASGTKSGATMGPYLYSGGSPTWADRHTTVAPLPVTCKDGTLVFSAVTDHSAGFSVSYNKIDISFAYKFKTTMDDKSCLHVPTRMFVIVNPGEVLIGGSATVSSQPESKSGSNFKCPDRTIYSSAKPAIASVTSDGVVTGRALGTAEIYATCNTVSGSGPVAVVSSCSGGTPGTETPSICDSEPPPDGGGSTPPPTGSDPGTGDGSGSGGVVCWETTRYYEIHRVYQRSDGVWVTELTGTWYTVTECGIWTTYQAPGEFASAKPGTAGRSSVMVVAMKDLPGGRGVAIARGGAADSSNYLLVDPAVASMRDVMLALKQARTLSHDPSDPEPLVYVASSPGPEISVPEHAQRLDGIVNRLKTAGTVPTPFGKRQATPIRLEVVLDGM